QKIIELLVVAPKRSLPREVGGERSVLRRHTFEYDTRFEHQPEFGIRPIKTQADALVPEEGCFVTNFASESAADQLAKIAPPGVRFIARIKKIRSLAAHANELQLPLNRPRGGFAKKSALGGIVRKSPGFDRMQVE